MYANYDLEEKGYLTLDESRRFFKHAMDLNYENEEGKKTLANIMKCIDPKSTERA
jgi:hypothetical protein